MRIAILTVGIVLINACAPTPGPGVTAEIIALERAALDKWNHGNPQGYLDTYAPEITYFDPSQANRLDGLEAMKAYYAPLTGRVKVSRYELIAPKVQHYGEVAILSFQLISYGANDKVLARWNSTEVYRHTEAGWKIAHNHWSFTQPELKVQPTQ